MANAKESTNPTVISKAAQVLGQETAKLQSILSGMGVEDNDSGYMLLKAKTTTEEYLAGVLRKELPAVAELKILAAASILKGNNPFSESEDEKKDIKPQPEQTATIILEAVAANRPISQMKDRELLERYIEDREYEIEQELHRRARYKRFIVLSPGTYESGKEIIDLEKSLDILKKARKMEIPQMASFEGKILQVFRITDLNTEDRKTELCPICGKPLFQGFCQDCCLDFGSIGMDERSYISLVVKKESFNASSFSDRKAVYASASKGLSDLRMTWPSVSHEYDELKSSNNLPQLVLMKPLLSEKKMDPFHVDGKRTF
jgi:hypothetical protein